jgi:hypothetical protein
MWNASHNKMHEPSCIVVSSPFNMFKNQYDGIFNLDDIKEVKCNFFFSKNVSMSPALNNLSRHDLKQF